MNLIIALVLGALTGWLAFVALRSKIRFGLTACVAIALVGAAMGFQLAPVMSSLPGDDAQLNVFALVISTAAACASLVVASMVAGRRNG